MVSRPIVLSTKQEFAHNKYIDKLQAKLPANCRSNIATSIKAYAVGTDWLTGWLFNGNNCNSAKVIMGRLDDLVAVLPCVSLEFGVSSI